MSKVTKTVQAELIEYTCSNCKKGVYRMTDNHPEDLPEWLDSATLSNWPTLYEMTCSNCGKKSKIAQPYPVLRYRLQEFVLTKHSAAKVEALRRLLRRFLDLHR